MADRYETIGYREDRPVASAAFEDADVLTTATVTVRDPALRTVNFLGGVSAAAAQAGGGPYAYLQFGPSRMGISNLTQTYSLEFNVSDTSGCLFASMIEMKVKQAGS